MPGSRLAQLAESAPSAWRLLQSLPALCAQAEQVLAASDFALRCLIQEPTLLEELWRAGTLSAPRSLPEFDAELRGIEARTPCVEKELSRALRRLRRREMLRIAWRDIAGVADTAQTLRECSWLAECAIAAAARMAAALLGARHGAPPAGDGGLTVLAMGKLGGGELNFSSDVDLIFLYPRGGETEGAAPLPLEEFYTRQGRLLIRLLDAVTEDGFVFRVDMRLRPFGDSGPLVASFAFLEDYLQTQGRDWERYAYVKARALTNADGFLELREQVLRPFVFRRYLDFGVFESLREMKALIGRDVARREQAENLKLGPGGIREIEFIVQSFQLVRGGQDRALRSPSLLAVLPKLQGHRLLPAEVVQQLTAAYEFLRRLENRVQEFDDAQVHALPAEPQSRQRIAQSLGYADVEALQQDLARHREQVAAIFAALFAGAGPVEADAARLEEVERLLDGSRLRHLDATGARRVRRLLQLLLADPRVRDDADLRRRLLTVLEAIGQRSAYFALLVEHRAARERLVELCGHGDFLVAQLAASPMLLDELLDARAGLALPDRTALAAELDHRLEDVGGDEVEREVEALCRFKQAAVFRVALADLSGRLPLMSVSDRLTEIAELILERALQFAWRQMTGQLGEPQCTTAAGRRAVRVAALAYGKLGGLELGYGSDLDLVFLHDSTGDAQETDRASPVDNQVFFLRFAQRLIHLLTMHSPAGRLYEVDVRLRPSGKGGFLVTSIEAFRRYQFEEAWTWEHQALLHARTVAGNAQLRQRIEAVRLEVLLHAVRRADLREKVREMRERMRRELSAAQPGEFDMKQDRGGIADIEFLAQYWALRWAGEYPPLVHYSDTIRQLESVASAALVPQAQVDRLVAAYQHYRQTTHRRSLTGLSGAVDAAAFEADRTAVAAIWRATMGETV